jgi:hypothetical protein
MLIGPPSALRFFEAASVAILAGLSVLLTRSVVCAELRPVDFAAELVVSIGHVTPPDGNGATAVPQRRNEQRPPPDRDSPRSGGVGVLREIIDELL